VDPLLVNVRVRLAYLVGCGGVTGRRGENGASEVEHAFRSATHAPGFLKRSWCMLCGRRDGETVMAVAQAGQNGWDGEGGLGVPEAQTRRTHHRVKIRTNTSISTVAFH
jgi:hypothetical protein